MALVTCPDCGRDVSSEAQACVGCGRPIAPVIAEPKSEFLDPAANLRGCMVLLAFLFLLGLVGVAVTALR